jgi:hypothetical protein
MHYLQEGSGIKEKLNNSNSRIIRAFFEVKEVLVVPGIEHVVFTYVFYVEALFLTLLCAYTE